MPINAALFHRTIHLCEGQLRPLDSRCPFCENTDRVSVSTLQDHPQILLLRCSSCLAVSASRMPTDETLGKYYGDYYGSSPSETAEAQVTFDEPQRLAAKLAKIYSRYKTDSRISILDFGGGDGTISYLTGKRLLELGAEKVNITVVDYHSKIVHAQKMNLVMNRVETLEPILDQFELVIASAVIEHDPRPRILLENLVQRLADGGIFYARTPYVQPLMNLLQRFGLKIDFTYPGHLHDLGQAFWEKFVARDPAARLRLLFSRPSIVETTFGDHFLRTLAAYALKAPWYVLGTSYRYVGGWEVLIQKCSGRPNGLPG